MTSTSKILPIIALSLVIPALCEAQIAITETAFTNSELQSDPLGGATGFTLSSFNMDGGNALVVAISAETVASGFNSFSVSFGGVAVTDSVVAISGTTAKQAAAVFYVINPSVTTGDVVVTFNYSSALRSDASVSVFALNNVLGVAPGGTATATATSAVALNLNYSGTAGGFMVMAGVDNKANSSLPLVSGDNFTAYSQRLASNFDANPSASGAFASSAAQAQAYGSIASTALFSTAYTPQGSGGSTRNAAALVAFEAIPEPSAFAALAGLGALGVAASRRHRRA
jgi:hypothetical protein